MAALEYVTLSTINSHECSGIEKQLELCVGGTAPRATVATFRATASGINKEDYTFRLESIGPDPVTSSIEIVHLFCSFADVAHILLTIVLRRNPILASGGSS